MYYEKLCYVMSANTRKTKNVKFTVTQDIEVQQGT